MSPTPPIDPAVARSLSAAMSIDVQFSPAVEPWPVLRDAVLVAEERGFTTAWAFDHFAGEMLRGTTMIECFTLLGALAASTTTIGLGSLVVNAANRAPGVTVQCAAAVHEVSDGRFTLGLGAGAAPGSRWAAEHAALGLDLGPTVAARRERVVQTLDALDRWWGDDRTDDVATFPLPRPRPPVILGVNSVGLAALAGTRADGINVRGDHELLLQLLDAADAARRDADRLDDPWDCSVWAFWDDALLDPEHPERLRWAALGVTRLVLVWLSPHDPVALARAVPHPGLRG